MKLIFDGLSVDDAKELLSSVEIKTDMINITKEEISSQEAEKLFDEWFCVWFAHATPEYMNENRNSLLNAFIAGIKAHAKQQHLTNGLAAPVVTPPTTQMPNDK